MIWDSLKLHLRLYHRPLAAMSGLIDEGNYVYAFVAVAIVSLLLQFSGAAQIGTVCRPLSFSPFGALTIVLSLALLHVPATILALVILAPLGSFSIVLRRDYGPLLVCTLMAWAASHLPLAIGLALMPRSLGVGSAVGLWLASALYFGALVVCAVRTLFGVGYGQAVGAVLLSSLAFLFEPFLSVLSSPFLLLWIIPILLAVFLASSSAYRQRQSFRRNLEASTINPRDAGAHYQLGLIHQHRHQYKEAIQRFTRAVEIDPSETDAHFQLGRIAREEGRLEEALDRFKTVVTQDDKHAQSEVWREIGATYAAASMPEEARGMLDHYLARRPYDPEGLYHYGETLDKLGRADLAREAFERCIEAAKTLPHQRRTSGRRWQKLAAARLSGLKQRGL